MDLEDVVMCLWIYVYIKILKFLVLINENRL